MSDDASIGQRIDDKVEQVRTELNTKIDELSARVDQLQAAIDARQAQGQNPEPEVPQVAPPPEATQLPT